MNNVFEFPEVRQPDFIVGPFVSNRVVFEGKRVPYLSAQQGDTHTVFVLDDRLSLEVPNDMAFVVGRFIADALAVGAGYPSFAATEGPRPWAPCMSQIFGVQE